MPQDQSDSIAGGSTAGVSGLLDAVVATAREVASAGLEVQAIMDLIARRTELLTGADGAAVELADGGDMVVRAGTGIASGHTGLRQKMAASLSGVCVTTGEIQECSDTEDDPRVDLNATRTIGMRSMVAVPLHHRGHVVGVLKVMSSRPNAFDDNDVRTLQLMTPYLGAVLANAAEGKARAEFVSVVSHELRNPLASIRGLASLMRDKPQTVSQDEQRKFSEAIVRQADRMAKLIEDVYDVSRLDAGELTFARITFDPEEVMRDAVGQVEKAWPGRRIELDLAGPLPTATGDPDRIRQVLINVIENACRYSQDAAPVRVGVRAADGVLVTTVADDGIGIAAEDMTRVFDRFARLPKPGFEQNKGTGLGLHISKAIVDAHGGRMWAVSKPGIGSVFHIELPVGR
jgi:signal transduction histidine kinase